MAIHRWFFKEAILTIAALLAAQAVVVAKTPYVSSVNRSSADLYATVFREPQASSYWVIAENNKISVAPYRMSTGTPLSNSQALFYAFDTLLNKSSISRGSSSIPSGTALLGLEFTPNVVYVNLSKDFLKGGGSTSMIARLTQVVYTSTSFNPNAKVYLAVDGKLLDENTPLGGEGLLIQQPLTRQQLAQDFALH